MWALLLSTVPAAADSVSPTLLVLTPARNGVVTGLDTVKVQYWDADGPDATTPLEWRVDGTGLWNTLTAGDINSNYSCGSNCAVYEFDLDTTSGGLNLANGSHTLNLRATDGAANTGTLDWPFTVNNPDVSQSGGSGMLLRRSSGSQLCIDCHNLPAHSSQTTDTGYGNWAVGCLDCHQPHGGTNIFLIRQQIETPNSGLRSVRFEDNTVGAVADSSTPGSASFANEDNATQADGPCQVCHTQTGGATARWRNAASGGNVQTHYTVGVGTQPCTNCHAHSEGFRGAGACLDCHGIAGAAGTIGPNSRREVNDPDANDDFGKESHHVGSGGATMGGTLTSFDCVVCHAEGRVDTSGATNEVRTVSAYHGGDGGTTSIDLKDADNWDDATGTGTVYVYDKDEVATQAGAAANWSSANQYWREWTSGVDEGTCSVSLTPCSADAHCPGAETCVNKDTTGADLSTVTNAGLDPFCLSCHDGGANAGATASANSTDTECGGSADALNPFCDGSITNEYDQQDRTSVVDIKSKVTATSDLDGDGTPDPPDGIYARHAVRGQSESRYGIYQSLPVACDNEQGPSPDPCESMFEAGFLTSMGTDEIGNPLWNDTSVMGCADCHTVDGANGATGNAHGSDSEYLLKDSDGGALEGTLDDGPSPDPPGLDKYICFRCHVETSYSEGTGHTGNNNDYQDSVLQVGAVRLADPHNTSDQGTIFGIACMNCHGGAADSATIAPEGFGRIHGTSQTFGTGQNGGGPTRNAYRFTNGGGLRYYTPGTWSAVSATCFTLSGTGDDWSGCVNHGSSSRSHSRNLLRPLDYD